MAASNTAFTADPSNAARVLCPICGASCSLTKAGAIRQHGYKQGRTAFGMGGMCSGTGAKTRRDALEALSVEAERIIARIENSPASFNMMSPRGLQSALADWQKTLSEARAELAG